MNTVYFFTDTDLVRERERNGVEGIEKKAACTLKFKRQ